MPRDETQLVLGMMVSNIIFELTGFGPSKVLCDDFVDRVMTQASDLGVTLALRRVNPVTR
jgi:hypothetical protein